MNDREAAEASAAGRHAATAPRAKRRGVDPVTTDRDYTADQVEFMTAMDHYRRTAARPFPTWSEALEVLVGLGYRKVAPADA